MKAAAENISAPPSTTTELTDDDPRHGTENGYRHRCRCFQCRMAHAEQARTEQAARRGSLAPDDPRHGTYNGYKNYGCRLPCCRAARRAYADDYAARLAARVGA